MHQALPPPLPPPYGMGPIYWSHMRSSPSPPVVWWGCGTVPLPPLWCGGWVPYTGPIWDLPPPPPVVWWGCGTVPLPPCGVVDGSHILVPYIVWMVGMVCKSVGYGMFDMTVCMVCMVCMVTMMGMEYVLSKVGMVCMACMLAIVCMLLYVW